MRKTSLIRSAKRGKKPPKKSNNARRVEMIVTVSLQIPPMRGRLAKVLPSTR